MIGIAKIFSRLVAICASCTFTSAAIIVVAAAGVANAQNLSNNDYYSINRTQRGTDILKAVEQYHLGPAQEELKAKRYITAKGHLDFILQSMPNHPQALQLSIEVCTRWKSPVCTDDLPTQFDNAIAVNPTAAGTFVVLGIYQQRMGAVAEAIKSYEHALSLNPDSMNAHYSLGLAYLDNKQYDLANVHAQQAYKLGAPLPGLRDKLIKAGRWDTAVALPSSSPESSAGANPTTTGDGADKIGQPK